MKNWLLLFLITGLVGCKAMLGGASPTIAQWKKNGVPIQMQDFKTCYDRKIKALPEREAYLYKKGFSRTMEEEAEWDSASDRIMTPYYDCSYELGYRFSPSSMWCSMNKETCEALDKYRN